MFQTEWIYKIKEKKINKLDSFEETAKKRVDFDAECLGQYLGHDLDLDA
jgi:hypothetical protein